MLSSSTIMAVDVLAPVAALLSPPLTSIWCSLLTWPASVRFCVSSWSIFSCSCSLCEVHCFTRSSIASTYSFLRLRESCAETLFLKKGDEKKVFTFLLYFSQTTVG